LKRLLTFALAASLVLALAVVPMGAQGAKGGGSSKPTIQFKSGGANVSEGQTSIGILVTRSAKDPDPSPSVHFRTAGTGNTAQGGADCTDPETDYVQITDLPVTFGPSSTTATPTVQICNNTLFETNETVILELFNQGDGFNLGSKRSIPLTINDNDNAPVLEVVDATPVNEGAALQFTVSKTGVALVPTSVNYASASGTLAPPLSAVFGLDFSAADGIGQLSWAGNNQSDQLVTVPTTDDSIDEVTENMRLLLSSPVNGAFADSADSVGAGQILDLDAAPTISIANASENEDGSHVFTISLSGPTASTASALFGTSPQAGLDAATEGTGSCDGTEDYIGQSGTLVQFAPGDPLTKTVTVTSCLDGTSELVEAFNVGLSSLVYATPGTVSALGLILNDDALFSVNDPAAVDEDGPLDDGAGNTITFTVSLAHASIRTTTVNVATADVLVDAAQGGAGPCAAYLVADGTLDYVSVPSTTLTFLPGETSKNVVVTVCPDDATESEPEHFSLDLSTPTTDGVADGASAIISATDGSGAGQILN
jgi:Calx-beta domain